jgi:response regulator of citrate/malate metabolism
VIDLELEDGRGLDLVQSVVDSGTRCGFTITGKKVLPQSVKEAIRLGVKGFLKSPIDLNRLDELFSRPKQST